jgi:HlyD family secretion protein
MDAAGTAGKSEAGVLARMSTDLRVSDFSAEYLQMVATPPSPAPRVVLLLISALLVLTGIGLWFGRIDMVAVADGKLVPQSFLKVVQPTDPGVIRAIRVREGDRVQAGQVLFQMDTHLSDADRTILETELALRQLQLRRIDAEIGGTPFERHPGERVDLFAQVLAQFNARRRAFGDMLAAERSTHEKALGDLRAAQEIEEKLKRTAPIYREQERAWEQLAKEGYAGKLLALERQRNRIENEQDMQAQAAAVASAKASINLAEKKLAQLNSGYVRDLNNERLEAQAHLERLRQDLAKQAHRSGYLELKASSDGVVKEIATHTVGTVVSAGTILATLVPKDEPLEAEIWLNNSDVGQVAVGANVKLKLAAFPFQRYGMLDGVVRQISADATERQDPRSPGYMGLQYRALVSLTPQTAPRGALTQRISPGMQISAEIHMGTRSVLDYLLSPIRKSLHEAGREI